MRSILKYIFKGLDFELSRIQKKTQTNKSESENQIDASFNSMRAGLIRCKQRGISPSTVIDVGAAEGKWTLAAMDIWKDCKYLLIEPLKERKKDLENLEKKFSNVHFVNAGAGEKQGFINFFVTNDLDGSGIADNGSHTQQRTIEVTTIDIEIEKYNLPAPYVIKLDTHGYEVPILVGATETIKSTSLLIIECYGFKIAPKSLLFWEMCKLMQEKGFRLVDIVDTMRRDKDQAFWQCDAFFVPMSSSIFDSNTYN